MISDIAYVGLSVTFHAFKHFGSTAVTKQSQKKVPPHLVSLNSIQINKLFKKNGIFIWLNINSAKSIEYPGPKKLANVVTPWDPEDGWRWRGGPKKYWRGDLEGFEK